jgi:hypothetical protein
MRGIPGVEDFSSEGFALLGLNPRCGCPLAVDMTASPDAAQEFTSRGLLLEYLPPSAAESAWESAEWPCPHHGVAVEMDRPPSGATAQSPAPVLRLV